MKARNLKVFSLASLAILILLATLAIPGPVQAHWDDWDHNFGFVPVGTSSCSNFIWTNSGDVPGPPIKTRIIQGCSSSNPKFSSTPSSCSGTIDARGTYSVTICYSPSTPVVWTDQGNFNLVTKIQGTTTLENNYINLRGSGCPACLVNGGWPTSGNDFGQVAVGAESPVKSLEVHKYCGANPISVTSVTSTNPSFLIKNGASQPIYNPYTLDGPRKAQIGVSCKPLSDGPLSAIIHVATTGGNLDYTVYCTGIAPVPVAATAGPHGTINPANTTVIYGGSKSFTINPDQGYCLDQLTKNGSPVSNPPWICDGSGGYNLTGVTSPVTLVTLHASFKIKPPPDPQDVPAMGPVGAFVVIGGLFWLVIRRKK